jgi:hypothetical protein
MSSDLDRDNVHSTCYLHLGRPPYPTLVEALSRLVSGARQEEQDLHLPLRKALEQLLAEVLAAGFGEASDFGWPKAIRDAQDALMMPI